MPESKHCAQCGTEFQRPPGRSRKQWECMCCCSASCANTIRARAQRPFVKTMEQWAERWENHRRREDQAELADVERRHRRHARLSCRIADAPMPRHFIGWYCANPRCREPFVYFAKRAQSRYCAQCNEAHHRRPANRRARQNGARYEVIVPLLVFQRDGWRCQICKRKTRGTFPALLAPTIDHIIPLAAGGDHVYENVQCACFGCNARKRDGSANDQLRLAT